MTYTFKILMEITKLPFQKRLYNFTFLPLVGKETHLFISSEMLNIRKLYNFDQANKWKMVSHILNYYFFLYW